MNAVQRWYVYSTGPVEFEKCVIIPESPPQKWVRDEDVCELERVIEEQSFKHSDTTDGLRRQLDTKNFRIGRLDDDVMRLNGIIAARDAEIKRLKEYEWMYKDLQS